MNYLVLSVDYVAGFIDGEGCIGLYYNKNFSLPLPRIAINSTSRSVIFALKATFDAWEIQSNIFNRKGMKGKRKPQYGVAVSSQKEAETLLNYLEKRMFFPKNHKPSKEFEEFAQKTVDDLKMLKQYPF